MATANVTLLLLMMMIAAASAEVARHKLSRNGVDVYISVVRGPLPRGKQGKKGVRGEKVSSCKELKSRYPAYGSDEYRISLPSGEYQVYCEMGINGGGYTFISRAMASRLTASDLSVLRKDRHSVLLRISRPDGTQPYTVVQQHGTHGGLIVNVNSHHGNNKPVNHLLGPYIYLSTLPGSVASTQGTSGFISNGRYINFTNCDRSSNAFFAFFPNPHEKKPSTYHNNNLVYERRGVAVDWRRSAKIPYSGSRIPLRYYFLTEMHYGGCGCYTSSDRWLAATSAALGAAIGVR